ncbi:MAG: hypothetical protein JNL39_03465 [Opitutaceae bacterium]|nr:hypothetical protein [Opitutaceae bacterium]
MPTDRLAELRRQRALVQEHLAWLEREITATEKPPAATNPGQPPPAASLAPHPAARSPAPATPDTATAGPPVDDILDQYRAAPGSVRQDVRKGCLLYFTLALVIFAAGVAILYFALGPR